MKNHLLTCGFYSIIVASIISGSCTQRTDKNNATVSGDSLYLKNVPSQPGEDTWKFIEDLKSPMWTQHAWEKADPDSQQADLSAGVNFRWDFLIPKRRLGDSL